MTLSPSLLIGISLAFPLLVLLLIGLLGRSANLRDGMTLVLSSVLFYFVCCLADHVFQGGRPEWLLGSLLPGFTVAFKVEPLGMVFALVASGLWIVTTVYGIGYMRAHDEQHQTRFFGCFAIAIFAALAAAFSANLFTLFVAYELMTISTYPLVTHHGTEKAKRGGRTYLGILLFTSIAFFMMAIGWTWSMTHTLDFKPGGILQGVVESGRVPPWQLALLLALFAFGIGKAALMPFHRWLPAAMVAPTPVSALLHAVAVVKAGTFGCVRLVHYVFGVDLLRAMGADTILAVAAALTILLASVRALGEQNLKRRLAYSTVSQLSYIVLGAAIGSTAAVAGAMFHIVAHGFMKITLFFCAGAILVALHKTEISDMKGIGRQMPFTMFAFLIGALSIIGIPPFAGAWSKWYLVLASIEAHRYVAAGVLLISSLLNVLYLLPIPIYAFFASATDDHHADGLHEAPLACVLPLSFTAIGCLVLYIYPDPVLNLLLMIGEAMP